MLIPHAIEVTSGHAPVSFVQQVPDEWGGHFNNRTGFQLFPASEDVGASG